MSIVLNFASNTPEGINEGVYESQQSEIWLTNFSFLTLRLKYCL